MRDEQGDDDKVLTVPASDPRWGKVEDIGDLSVHLLNEIAHFFAVHKDLEAGKMTEVRGWAGAGDAARSITAARTAASAAPGWLSARGASGSSGQTRGRPASSRR